MYAPCCYHGNVYNFMFYCISLKVPERKHSVVRKQQKKVRMNVQHECGVGHRAQRRKLEFAFRANQSLAQGMNDKSSHISNSTLTLVWRAIPGSTENQIYVL